MRRIKNNKIDISSINSRIIKNSKITLKLLKNISLIIIIIQAIVFSSIVISEPKLARSILVKLSRRVLWSFDTFEIEDYGNYIKELFIALIPIRKSIERLDLSIDIENLAGLDCSRKYNSSFYKDKIQSTKNACGRYWFNGKLSHDGAVYDVKLRTKGDRTIHYNNFKNMSLKADIKGFKRFKGMEEFSIQTPIIRNYTTELFAAKLMRDEGIISPRNFYVKFFINGEYRGIRHIEEGFSRELIEFNKRRYGPLFSLEEKFGKKYKKAIFDLHDSKYWGKDDFSMNLPNQARTILESSKTNKDFIKKYFDLDKWAKYFAIIDAFGLWHGAMPKSVKYFLNPTTGLIEPVFYDGHLNATRILENYNFYKIYNNKTDIYCAFICDPNENFYNHFFGTREEPEILFYSKYKTHLKRITDKNYFSKNINPKWESLSNERGHLYKELWRIDRISNPGILPHVAPWKKITKRINKINNDFLSIEKVNPLITINEKESEIISLENNYSDIPQIIKLKCLDNGLESNNFILIKNKKVKLENYKINKCDLNNIVYSLNDFQTSIKVKDGYLLDYDLRYSALDKSVSELNKLNFDRGINQITDSIYINQKDITFSEGSVLCLDEKSIIHINNSKVDFQGTINNPVIIKNCRNNNGKSGSLIIENSDVLISNLLAYKLSKPKIKLRSLDGALNFVDSNIKIDLITSEAAFSEDAINFINSSVKARDIKIFNSLSDGIDSDFSRINIKNIICKNVGNDCFDASFTQGFLSMTKASNVKDKVISIGESSDLYVEKVEINNSEIGIAVKDSSSLTINKFAYSEVKLPIATYIKKEEFGSPSLFIKSISPNDNKNFLISNDSNVEIQGILQKTNLKSKDVEKLLYGNKFGIKTIR